MTSESGPAADTSGSPSSPPSSIPPVAPPLLPPLLRRVAPYIALTFAAFIAYLNIYDNAFLFDDDLLITMNRTLRDWNGFGKLFTATTTAGAGIAGGFFRPVQNLLYFLIYQTGGQNPFGFHLLNVALHATNACLAFALSRRLGFSPLPALLALLLWTVHPLHTEAITYMSGTADPLFVFFMLVALVWLAPDFRPTKICLSLPLFFLALMSKENALVFPALVMVCMFLALPGRKFDPRRYLKTLPLWLLAFAYLYWRYTADDLDGPARYAKLFQLQDFSNWSLYAQHPLWRILTFLATIPDYLSLIVLPHDLHIERSFAVFASWQYLAVIEGAAILILALAQLGWGRGQRGIALSWGLLWFFASHFPNTGLFIPMNSLFLEHWMYLPTLGLFLGVGETLGRSLEPKRWSKAKTDNAANIVKIARIANIAKTAVAGLAMFGCVALGAKTLAQNTVWYSPFTLYPHIFANGERSPRAHNNLALAYEKRRQIPEAIEELRKAIEEGDTYAETHHNLALALLSLPDGNTHKEEAIKELHRALEIEPDFYRSHLLLSQLHALMGKSREAAEETQKARALLQRID